jgi:hypothetical protein
MTVKSGNRNGSISTEATMSTLTTEMLARYDESAQTIWLANFHDDPESEIDLETRVRGNIDFPLDQLSSPARVVQLLEHFRNKMWFTNEMFLAVWDELMLAFVRNGYDPHNLPPEIVWKPRKR